MLSRILKAIGQWYNRLPIAHKMQISTISTVIVLLVTFIFVILLYFNKILLNQAIASARKDILYVQNKFDALFDRAETYALTLLSDETVQDYLYKAPIQKQDKDPDELKLLAMQKYIRTIISADESVNAVMIYDMQGRVYDSGITMHPTDRVLYDYSRGAALWISTHKAPYRGIFDSATTDRQIISFIRTIGSHQTGQRIGFLEICIDERTVAGLYSETVTDNNKVFIISREGSIVSHPDKASLYIPFKQAEITTNTDFIEGKDNFVISQHYPRLDWYIVETISKKTVLRPILRILNTVFIIGLVVLALSIIIVHTIAKRMTHNITKLASALSSVSQHDWADIEVDIKTQDEIGVLAVEFRNMLREIRDKTTSLLNEQNSKREYQLELLQQQINPHFLYNTLDNVCALAQLGYNDKLVLMIGDITRFYRGVLNRGGIIISLRQELNIARSYLNIMQVRFFGSFTYLIRCPNELLDNVCLRLTLQPLLENAINHAFITNTSSGLINIGIHAFGEYIIVEIKDNGNGMSREDLHKLRRQAQLEERKSGFGLITVHQRIKLYFGQEYGMKVYSRPGQGTRILIKLPHKVWNAPEYNEKEKSHVFNNYSR
jgi:two-component system sensor histidine kinase YesM